MGHIHGVAENSADGRIYVATHTGVYKIVDGTPRLVANRYQDTMGFTVVGPDDFLASGHPALNEDLPNPLGLIQSTDRATTWRPIAFSGEQDFHSIDAVPSLTYAYAADGRLLRSSDRKSWASVLEAPLIDFTLNPQSPNQILATTETGVLLRSDGADSKPEKVSTAPPLALVDRTLNGDIVGVDPSGQVFLSEDDAATWSQVSPVGGQPEAVSVRASTWYIATTTGVFSSSNRGSDWKAVLRGEE